MAKLAGTETAHRIATYLIGAMIAALAWFTTTTLSDIKADIKEVKQLAESVQDAVTTMQGDLQVNSAVDASQDRRLDTHDDQIEMLDNRFTARLWDIP